MIGILQIIAAAATVVTGLYSLVVPMSVRGFTGLEMPDGRGVTEVRAVLGGFFIALGAAPLLFRSPDMYLMLGFTYLIVAGVRAVSIFIDKSFVKSNYISFITEIILGIFLVL